MAVFLCKALLLWSALEPIAATAEAPRVVQMQMSRNKRSALQKRDPFTVTLGNVDTVGLYYVNASVGTPPQIIQLQIDTGSSDVWMFGPNSCEANTSQCLGGECKSMFQSRSSSQDVSSTIVFLLECN